MKGKIVIKDNKVYFKPDGLEKPKREDFYSGKVFLIILWKMEIRDYEASKRVIEVSNVYWTGIMWMFRYKTLFGSNIKDGQSCEAEVENNVATIIELINEKECPICCRTDNHKHGEFN